MILCVVTYLHGHEVKRFLSCFGDFHEYDGHLKNKQKNILVKAVSREPLVRMTLDFLYVVTYLSGPALRDFHENNLKFLTHYHKNC